MSMYDKLRRDIRILKGYTDSNNWVPDWASGEYLKMDNDELLDFEYLNSVGIKYLQKKFDFCKVKETLNIDWLSIPYNRIALINYIATKKPNAKYLEIGCENDRLFHSVPFFEKIGVDPVKGGTHKMTSDEFFKTNTSKFDIIFIDGLHNHDQVHRDIQNAINNLSPDGWIAIHDMIPRTWLEEHVPRISGIQTGNVWKVALELMKTPGLDFKIVMIDHGVGLIKLDGKNIPELFDMRENLKNAKFKEFLDKFPFLPKISWNEAIDWINTYE
jgi:hypothetical protein